MRFLPLKTSPIVTLSITPTLIVCSLMEKTKKGATIKAYESFESYTPVQNSMIFNYVRLTLFLQEFIKKYSLRNPTVRATLAGAPVVETIVSVPHANPGVTDFISCAPQLRNMHIASRYLFSTDDNNFTFYVCGIPHYLIFQYQLMALMAEVNLTHVTTEFDALMRVHFHLNRSANKRQQDIVPHIHEQPYFKSLTSAQVCAQHVRFGVGLTVDLRVHAPNIMKACGLLYTGDI